MASGVFSQPLDLAAAGTSRWMTRHLRLAVPVLVLLICGSFAAATILQIRQSRSQAIAEARLYESRRAADLAAVTGAALDRFAEAGRLYAGNPAAPLTMAGLINIALFDRAGVQRAALRPDSARPSAPANRSAPAAQGRCRARPAAPALSAGASAPAARGGTARWPAQRHAPGPRRAADADLRAGFQHGAVIQERARRQPAAEFRRHGRRRVTPESRDETRL